jgi:phage N-6-adenine-methyltransferase
MRGCNNKLGPMATGRPRKFCSDMCRKRAQRQAKKTKVYHRSKSDEWTTPQDVFDKLNREFGFTVDVAATEDNTKCPRFYHLQSSGLAQDWSGEVAWCNPPYSQSAKWVEKAYNETRDGNCTVVMLLRVSTGNKTWQRWVLPHAEVRYVPGRLRFGDGAGSAPFDSAVVIFK